MGRNNRYQYLAETKEHKKLYKSKKLWLVAGITGLAVAGGGAYQTMQSPVTAHADTITSNASSASDSDASAVYDTSAAPVSSAPTSAEQVYATSNAPVNTQSSTTVQVSTSATEPTSTNQAPSTVATSTAVQSNTASQIQQTDNPVASTNTENTVTNDSQLNSSLSTDNESGNAGISQGSVTDTPTNVYQQPSTSVTSSAESFDAPNADLNQVSNHVDSLSNQLTVSDVNVTNNLNSGANYALSSANQSNQTNSNPLENELLGADGNNGNGSDTNETSNATSSNNSTTVSARTPLATAVYSNPKLDLQIEAANQQVQNILKNTNNEVADLDLRDVYNDVTLTTSSSRPTSTITHASTMTIGNTVYNSPSATIGIDQDEQGQGYIHFENDETVTAGNNQSPYAGFGKITNFEYGFLQDANGRSPVVNPLNGTKNAVLTITRANGTTQQISIPNLDTYVVQSNGNQGMYSDNVSDYATSHNAAFQNAPTTNNNGSTPYNGMVSYEDINVGQILRDNNNGQDNFLQTGDNVRLSFDQSLTGAYLGTGYTTKPAFIGMANGVTKNQTTPILIHYINKATGNDIQNPQYITAATNNEFKMNDQISVNVPSPTNWNYTGTFTNKIIINGQSYDVINTPNQYAGPNGDGLDALGNQIYYTKNNVTTTNASTSQVNVQVTGLAYDSQTVPDATENVYLYYVENQPIPVNPDHPETPGAPTDTTNPSGPKYTSDADPSNLLQGVTETIHYVDANTGATVAPDSTQTVYYGRTLVVEKYSGKELGWASKDDTNPDIPMEQGDSAWHLWPSKNSTNTTNAVTSPDLSSQGYGSPDQAVVSSQTLNRNQPIVITVKYNHSRGTFTPDQASAHGQDESNFKQDVSRTINYVDAQNGATVSPSDNQTVEFTRDGVYDRVTNQFLGYTSATNPDSTNPQSDGQWSSTNDNYTQVISPDLSSKGYKPGNPSSVAAETPSQTSGHEIVTVKYDHQTGIFTPDQAAAHGQNPNDFQKNLTRTINYLDAVDKTTVVSTPVVQTASATRDGVYDKVTNQLLGYTTTANSNVDPNTTTVTPQQGADAAWTITGNFGAVTSPNESAKGYDAPDKAVVNRETPTDANNNEIVNVYYPHGSTSSTETKNFIRTIEYEDATNGKNIAPSVLQPVTVTRTDTTDKVTGKVTPGTWTSTSGQHWNAVVSPDLSKKGYDPASLKQVDAVADSDINGNPIIIVKYNHTLLPSDVEHQTINRTIHYVDELNHNTVAPDAHESVEFTRTGVIDQVTKKLVGYSSTGTNKVDIDAKDADKAWIPNNSTFLAIQSPDLTYKGYTAPSAGGAQENVIPYQKDVDETVYYGHQKAFVGPDSGDQPGGVINPNDPNSVKWPSDIAKDNLQHDIIRTIHYTDKESGKEISQDVIQDVTYHRMAVIDKVTGQILGWSLGNTRLIDVPANDGDNAWQTDDDQWAKQISPDLTGRGYNVQTVNAQAKSIRPNDKNVEMTIPYTHQIVPVDYTQNIIPGQPINPNDPDGPKWPAGTDKNSLYKEITRTIQYLDGDTNVKVNPDMIEKVLYYRTAMVDKVTGQLKGYALNHDNQIDLSVDNGDKAWQSNDNKWEGVDSPDIDGYDKPDVYRVHSQLVAADQKDALVQVKYYKHKAHSCPAPTSAPAVPVSKSVPVSAPAQVLPAPAPVSDVPTEVITPVTTSTTPAPTSSSAEPIDLDDAPDSSTADDFTFALSDEPVSSAAPAQPAEPTTPVQAPMSAPVQSQAAPSVATPMVAASTASSTPVQSQAPASSSAQLPQTGESHDVLESELIGLLLLAFAELLRRMPHMLDKKKSK